MSSSDSILYGLKMSLKIPKGGNQNPQKKKDKRTNNNTHKTNDRVTRTPLKIGGEPGCSGRVTVPAPL